jgi:hypothetical protein
MSETQKHTPTPWYVAAMNDCLFIFDRAPSPAPYDGPIPGGSPATVIAKLDYPKADANAAFIVRAVNAHDDLVKALEQIAGMDDKPVPGAYARIARAALSKAGE